MKTQLESLTEFFCQNVPERAQQGFDSIIDEMQVVPAAKDLGLNQYRQAVIRYSAVLSWERFPYRLCAPQLLISLLLAWTDEYGSDVMEDIGITDADPEWDVSVEDAETATVVLTMPLAEELVIRQDDKGDIPWNGARWSLVDPEIWTALSARVIGTDETGAPIGDA
ncbi:phage tail protein [Enterobacter cloacae]|uniref:phage tail protein n=1 Tax=Enterobacter cloacae TaxID=550 RepID=UPI002B1E8DA5|nr:phage tail protein [Enterobacter cloacae]MEA3725888.1 phage tail protein [Enterobacter cloacae]MEA3730833.1 phage tail protein [Enterobacter cloacae]MEA3740127.1 phage tail protein [Enterobacter cloacae]MEA3754018.1 phage tail protein [Enterobacter cloacae]MEA3768094.1 phage tail protein [Enterobacter cloacae]